MDQRAAVAASVGETVRYNGYVSVSSYPVRSSQAEKVTAEVMFGANPCPVFLRWASSKSVCTT